MTIEKYTRSAVHTGQNAFSTYSGSGLKKKTSKNIILTTLEDSVRNSRAYNQEEVSRLFKQNNIEELRKISKFFYNQNAIYRRIVEYFSTMYLNYWSVTPRRVKTTGDKDQLMESWFDLLDYVEAINPEALGTTLSRKVLIEGEVYIVVKETISNTKAPEVGIQYLPLKYCRTRKKYGNRDVVDFNVKFFDDKFRDAEDKEMALQTMPKVLSDAYYAYQKLTTKKQDAEWVSLDPNFAFRFSLDVEGIPLFTSMLIDLLDLSDVKDLTMFKLEQELSKILVQQFGVDKDGNPIVDVPVMQNFHDNTAQMLQDHPGVDVVTTLAKVSVEDLTSSTETSSNNPLSKSTEAVYNAAGVSSELMNATTSGALVRSILVDESLILGLVLQLEEFLNVRIDTNIKKFRPEALADEKRFRYRLNVLPVTHYNRESMIKWYKEQTTLGYSKFLPPIALGQRQSDIMSALFFENEILDLGSMMIPPMSSNTMSANVLQASGQSKPEDEREKAGRPEKAEEDRSEKTEQNRESE